MERGYYRGPGDEITFVSGQRTGNCFYNPWADQPRWAGLMPELIDASTLTSIDRLPEDIPRAPSDKETP